MGDVGRPTLSGLRFPPTARPRCWWRDVAHAQLQSAAGSLLIRLDALGSGGDPVKGLHIGWQDVLYLFSSRDEEYGVPQTGAGGRTAPRREQGSRVSSHP